MTTERRFARLSGLSARAPLALVAVSALCAAAAVAGCTYDFDAAFAEPPIAVGGGSLVGGTGGTAGAGAEGATGGGGGATPTGGAGGSVGELCTNGADDDGDTLVDCQDPDCGAFACAASPPANWSGPIAFALVPGQDPLPSCAAAWPASSTAFDQPQPSPLDCSPCACGDATVSCSLASTDSFTTTSCSGLELSIAPLGEGICTPFNVQDMDSLRARSVQVTGNPSCAPSGGDAVITEPNWGEVARLCTDAPFGGGCEANSVCVPGATVSFALCITRAGDEPCPPGYPQKTVLFSSFDDNRSCSACGCGSPAGVTCTAESEVWELVQDCSGPADHVLVHGAGCTVTGRNAISGSLLYTATGTADGCTPTGGNSQGAIAPTEPITVCCAP